MEDRLKGQGWSGQSHLTESGSLKTQTDKNQSTSVLTLSSVCSYHNLIISVMGLGFMILH